MCYDKDMDKKHLRAQCRKIREALTPEQVAAASRQICDHIAAWALFQQSRTVMTYMAFRNEIDLGRLQTDFPQKQWVIPRIAADPEPHLILHPYDPARLTRHRFGMLEPDLTWPVIAPDQVEMVLTPGLAYDRRGFRLGFGGGFYDRFLPLVRALKVGVVYCSLIVEATPAEAHDYAVDYLACEEGIMKCAR